MASIKLKPRARNGNIDIKLLIKHPMETGLRKSKGKLVPANHITDMTVAVNGTTVMKADIGSAVSKDPYFKFSTPGNKGDEVTVSYNDNKGKSGTAKKKA
jgi:sulfur-oxidizing protein SoxZ